MDSKQETRQLKLKLLNNLSDKVADELTDSEVDIMLLLTQEPEIREILRASYKKTLQD